MIISESRILKIFKEVSKDFYKKKGNNDQKSKHWKNRYQIKEFNEKNLVNFRSSGLNLGLDDQTESFKFKIFAEVVNYVSEQYVLSNLPKKNIGNSKELIKYQNLYMDYNKLIQIHWFYDIENSVLKNNKISSICEIGGGFGSFAELIIRNYNTKLLSIDLPEANVMTTYYLKESLPGKSFYLYDDYKKNNYLSYEDFLENDIIILPPNLNIDPKIKIDFFINTRSMMEMNFSAIQSYFDLIHKLINKDGFFLNINRYQKTSVGEEIRISEYPYDKHWSVITSKPSYNQNWVHFLLTKRNMIQQEQNVKEELDGIKKIESQFYGKYIDIQPGLTKAFIRKLLKIIVGIKLLNLFGNFLLSIGTKLKKIN
jgi:hypothetical protein